MFGKIAKAYTAVAASGGMTAIIEGTALVGLEWWQKLLVVGVTAFVAVWAVPNKKPKKPMDPTLVASEVLKKK